VVSRRSRSKGAPRIEERGKPRRSSTPRCRAAVPLFMNNEPTRPRHGIRWITLTPLLAPGGHWLPHHRGLGEKRNRESQQRMSERWQTCTSPLHSGKCFPEIPFKHAIKRKIGFKKCKVPKYQNTWGSKQISQ
jgi:hypothetical protein